MKIKFRKGYRNNFYRESNKYKRKNTLKYRKFLGFLNISKPLQCFPNS